MPSVKIACVCQSSRAPDDTTAWAVTATCGHFGHLACFNQWLDERKKQKQPFNCPICRAETLVSSKGDGHGRRKPVHFVQLYFEGDVTPDSDTQVPFDAVMEEEDDPATESESEDDAAGPVGGQQSNDLMELRRQLGDARVSLRQQAALKEELKELKTEFRLCRESLEGKEDDIEALNETIAALHEQIEGMGESQPQELQRLKDENEDLDRQLATLRERVKLANEEKEALKTKSETQVGELVDKYKNACTEVHKLRQKLNLEGDEGAVKIKELKLKEKAVLSDLKKANENAAYERGKAEIRLEAAKKEAKDAEKGQRAAERKEKEVRNELTKVKNANQNYQNKLDKSRDKIANLQAQLASKRFHNVVDDSDDEDNAWPAAPASPKRANADVKGKGRADSASILSPVGTPGFRLAHNNPFGSPSKRSAMPPGTHFFSPVPQKRRASSPTSSDGMEEDGGGATNSFYRAVKAAKTSDPIILSSDSSPGSEGGAQPQPRWTQLAEREVSLSEESEDDDEDLRRGAMPTFAEPAPKRKAIQPSSSRQSLAQDKHLPPLGGKGSLFAAGPKRKQKAVLGKK